MTDLAPTQHPPGEFQSIRVKRILLVDDDNRIRQMVRNALENELGWICEEAENGVDGISKARALKPDLIVLDLSMPIMNGYDAATILTREMPGIPLVMLTLYADVIGKTSADIIGVKAIMSKTDGMAPLIRCVRKILEN
jgi:CheY-like chemotaxis protein